ncbi:MAG: ABC transporter substrate-binding protein [Myxococcota bacterium]
MAKTDSIGRTGRFMETDTAGRCTPRAAALGRRAIGLRRRAVRLVAGVSLAFVGAALVPALPMPALAQAAAAAKAPANAALTEAPRKLIDETAVKIVAILARKDDPAEKRVKEIEAIAYELFDFTTMSKLVLARNWRKLSTEQRTTFVREFKRHLSHTYGTRLDRYDQERVDVYAAQLEQRNDVTVKTRIVGGQFDGAEVSYRLRKQANDWRIIDVVIEGVSLVSNYRSQFQEVLNTGTIDDLLAKLRDKNFKVDEPKTTAKQG